MKRWRGSKGSFEIKENSAEAKTLGISHESEVDGRKISS
jgi:hypothetical protein